MLRAMRHRFCHQLSVRYADTDMQGHVFFANYFTFCDEAMTAYLHAIGCPPKELAELGVDFVYADARCSYTGSAKWEDRLHVHVRPAKLGRTSVRWELAVYRDGEASETIAKAELATVIVAVEGLRPTPIPARLREAIASYEGEPETGR